MANAIEDVQKAYAICTGTLLEVTGFVLLISRPIAGALGVSATGSLLYLGVGALGWLGLKGFGRTYNTAMGASLSLLGALGFVPGAAGVLRDLIGANGATATLHVIVGGVSLGMGLGVRD